MYSNAVTTSPNSGQSIYTFGDSITLAISVTVPSYGWPSQLAASLNVLCFNYGVGGQTVTTGTGNVFNTALIPTKTNDLKTIYFGWGVNDCWKAASIGLFNTDYTACINAAKAKGWTNATIKLITGFYVEDNAYFTQAQYLTYVTETQTIASSTGVGIVNLFSYMQANGAGALLADLVHPNNLGNTVIKNYLLIN